MHAPQQILEETERKQKLGCDIIVPKIAPGGCEEGRARHPSDGKNVSALTSSWDV